MSHDDVFLNCPFDAKHHQLLRAMTFSVYACGMTPRSALDRQDSSDFRLDKIYRLIEQCRFGIHDLSRTDLDSVNGLPRFNMPFELGLFMGAKRFGNKTQKQKNCLILDVDRYRFQKFISDIAGVDIQEHGGVPSRLVKAVRDWLATETGRSISDASAIWNLYVLFDQQLAEQATALKLDAENLTHADFRRLAAGWLKTSPG